MPAEGVNAMSTDDVRVRENDLHTKHIATGTRAHSAASAHSEPVETTHAGTHIASISSVSDAGKVPTRGIYDIVAVCFVAFLLLSNIAATKLIELDAGPLTLVFDGGAILFPLTYIVGDVLSEVYGFRFARRTILVGFVVQILASFTFWLAQIAPPAADYTGQEAFAAVLGVVPRFVAASICGYLVGQLLNSYVLVKIKERWGEKHLWARLLGSTVAGEAADTVIFCFIAWIGVVPFSTIANLAIVGYIYKVGVEAVLLPFTYAVVGWVKRIERTAIEREHIA